MLSLLLIVAWRIEARGRIPPGDGPFDAIVVLGCATRPGGGCSPALAARVEAGVELWSRGRAPVLLMSGGEVGGRPCEAHEMARLARSLGVPEAALALEPGSRSTRENAAMSAGILGSEARVVVVTDAFHQLRSRRIFRRHFSEVHGHGVLGSRRGRLRGALRELVLLPLQA
jgi:uncharacterized SAM-binding protein YcdF (DUF218 family)